MEPTVLETSEYVKTTDLDVLMGKIVSSLQPRIEAIVQESVKRAIEEVAAKTDEKIALAKGEIRGEFNTQLNQHIETERKERQSDIEAVNKQVKGFGDETRERLNEFNMLVGGTTRAVSEMKQTIEKAGIEINGWTNTLTSTRQQYEDTRHDIERLENESAITVKAQAAITEQVNSLRRSIHGGEGEDTPSVFSEFRKLGFKLDTQIQKTDLQVQAALQLSRDAMAETERLKAERLQEKERWQKPGKAVAALTKEAAKTPYFWFAVIFALIVVVAILRPEALAPLIEFAQNFFSAP